MAAGIGLVTAALNVIGEVLKKMPDYDQRKKEKYLKLLEDYENEKASTNRDDQRVDNLRDELRRFVTAFGEELREQNIS